MNWTAERKERMFFAIIPHLVLAGLLIWQFVAILRECEQHFIYTLDDPYIHLALARGIASGTYGINPGQAASPSSSAIWPFLLVPFSSLSAFEYVPFLLNVIIAFATLFIFVEAARFALVQSGTPARLSSFWASLVGILLMLATNLATLVFTGMEHNLQMLLSAAVAFGVSRVLAGQKVPGWLWAALVMAPLVRYECLAVTIPAAGVLLLRRQYRTALVGLLGSIAGLGLFSLFLKSQNLDWLPASVIAKAGFFGANEVGLPLLTLIKERVARNFIFNTAPPMAWATAGLLAAGLFYSARWIWIDRRNAGGEKTSFQAISGLWAGCAGVLHLLFGQFGWWYRYETYMVAVILLAWLWLARNWLAWLIRSAPAAVTALILVLFAMPTGLTYGLTLQNTYLGSANIYQQQYQMARFVEEYWKEPVAVNDLGWIAYRSPSYVLDLWGLASLDALRARQEMKASPAHSPDWMDKASKLEGVYLALIYEDWFDSIPPGWIPIGELRLGVKQVSAGSDRVAFFALDEATAERARELLDQFKPTLPVSVELDVY